MSETLLDKYVRSRPVSETARQGDDAGAIDDLGAFGWLRGVREHALMLELRLRDGSMTAFGYGWLDRLEWDPSKGITLYFGQRKVKIAGRNLNAEQRPTVQLVAGLVRHRVPWVQQASGPEVMEAPVRATVVETITLE